MSDAGGDDIPRGRPPSEEELFLLDWIKEAGKTTYQTLIDVLKQLVTINCAFVGILTAFAAKTILHKGASYFLVVCLIVASVIAFVGLVPDRKAISFNDVSEIRRVREAAIAWKYWCMMISASVMLGSLVLAFAFSLFLRP